MSDVPMSGTSYISAIEIEAEQDKSSCNVAADEPDLDHLPIVDIWNDPGIWVILDEGCNSNCHSTAWADNAIKKLAKHGFYPQWLSHEKKHFSGIGEGTATTGTRQWPGCIMLSKSKRL